MIGEIDMIYAYTLTATGCILNMILCYRFYKKYGYNMMPYPKTVIAILCFTLIQNLYLIWKY